MGRKAKKGVTINELKDAICKKANKLEGSEDYTVNSYCMESAVSCIYFESNTFSKDLQKINFDLENCISESEYMSEECKELGFKDIDGTAVLWCAGCGDWEDPVAFIIYLSDKNQLRAYIPENGNVYCRAEKCAWGSCEEPENIKIQEERASSNIDGWNEFDWIKMKEDVRNRLEFV